MKKILKYTVRALLWLLLFIIVLVVLVLLLIQTSPAKKKLASFASDQATEFVNGEVYVGSIEGNFFTNITLKNVLLTDTHQDTLAHIEEINVGYSLLPLLYNELRVNKLGIHRPTIFLKQLNDSTWNVQNIVKPSDKLEEDTVTSSGSFDIYLPTFTLSNGNLFIQSTDTIIPRKIEDLNTEIALRYTSKEQEVEIKSLSFTSEQPQVKLQQLKLQLSRTSQKIVLKDFYIKTALNKLQGAGQYTSEPDTLANATLSSDPLQLEEFEFFMAGFQLPATPIFSFDASLKKDSVTASVELKDKDQRININLNSANLLAFIQNQNEVMLQYNVKALFENIDVAHWLGKKELKHLVNGNLQIHGTGIKPQTASAKVDGDFNNCVVQGEKVESLFFNFDLNQGNLKGIAQGKGQFGTFKLVPTIRDFNTTPLYTAELTAYKLDLAPLTGNDSLRSDINFKALINGRGFEPKTMQADAQLVFSKSHIYKLQLDTLLAKVKYNKENLTIDTLNLSTKDVHVTANGNYSLNAHSDITLSAMIASLDEFAAFVPGAKIQARGKIDAHVWGKMDSLNLETQVELDETRYDSIFIATIRLDANALLTSKDTLINANLLAANLNINNLKIDSVSADLKAAPDSMYLDAKVAAKDANTQLEATIKLGEILKVTLHKWAINFKNQKFALQQTSTIQIDSTNYSITNFKLASGLADSAQYIEADGYISRRGTQDFKLNVNNIDVGEILASLESDIKASGLINVDIKLNGTAAAPILKGDIKWNKAMLSDYKFTDVGANFSYKQNQLTADALIVPQDSGRITLKGTFPIGFRLDSMKMDYNMKNSVDAALSIEKFPLSVLSTFDVADKIEGELNGQIDVKGSPEAPDLKGLLKLEDALIVIPQYGIDYRNMKFSVSFLRDKIKLDTLNIKSDDGSLTGTGEMSFNSDFYKGDVNNSNIVLTFDRFNPVDHKQFNMELSGKANIGGKKGEVVFGGDLTIPEARIYLPAVLAMIQKGNPPKIPKPILVREMEKMSLAMDTMTAQNIDTARVDSVNFDYFNFVTGKIKLKIPKNTWIKNEDMRIELSGDLEMIKHANFFEMFGTVDIVRGQYDLLGKTFMIKEGSVSFQGGEELLPHINIKATYSFRNSQKIEQEITVTIGGTSEEPTVAFTLDGSSISEGDALSFIIFGKAMNELTMDQQEDVGGKGDMATTAAASMLSSQLTNFLGDKLDVDYIEVKSNGGFDNATVVVGKYITNDLFVSYEQRFGETNEDDMSKYEVKLEYELFRFLFLQLNNSTIDSGFDVIFKVDAK